MMDGEAWAKLIGILFVVVLAVALAMCAPRTSDGLEIFRGVPVVIEVKDGRKYKCVHVASGHGGSFIDCKQVQP